MVYDFWGFFATIKGLQPPTIIFSDAGPDIRWVGNERGFTGETNWSPRDNEGTFPGFADDKQLNVGDENGTTWGTSCACRRYPVSGKLSKDVAGC